MQIVKKIVKEVNFLRISFTVLITSTVKLTYFKNSKLGIFIAKLLVKTLLAIFIMFFITTNHLKSEYLR